MSLWDHTRHEGFSLVEILVVLLIFAILTSIAVPTLIASQPQRNLAAAGDRFANDFNYCRAKAQSSGNEVYLGFIFQPDELQIQGVWDDDDNLPPYQNIPSKIGESFVNPANPGVSRVAKEYFIVEARPRSKPVYADEKDPSAGHYDLLGQEPYTYLDWLIDYDEWYAVGGPYPVEPLFPYDPVKTSIGALADPTVGPFNSLAAPLVHFPQDMRGGSGGEGYDTRFQALPNEPWLDGNVDDQQFKLFCIADQAEIMAYDVDGDRAYTKGIDHPRLIDQVKDYILLKRVELPEHVYFINPWRNYWVLGWEEVLDLNTPDPDDTIVLYDRHDMQFLQYLWEFRKDESGVVSVSLAEWTYDPEAFPDGNYTDLNHGTIAIRDDVPTIRSMWMVTDECIDFSDNTTSYDGSTALGARANLVSNKKSNLGAHGRIFTFWSLNGKYYVDDYTPNDSAREINENDPRLNMRYEYNGNPEDEIEEMPLVSREFGYSQNFLMPKPLT